MMPHFTQIQPTEIDGNAIQMIGNEWFLLSAGDLNSYNCMTAAWGGIGFLWKKPVTFAFVRPQRHTYKFMEENGYFSMCFFDEAYKDALNYCGTHSGKDVDKASQTGLTPLLTKNNVVGFNEARLIIECKKIYFDDIKPELFLDKSIEPLYNKDYHRMYIGEITNVYHK